MPSLAKVFVVPATQRGLLALAGVAALIIALRGLSLLYDHSLNSLDGALQTWFALHNFADGEQLGTDFQSYLGITMIIALLPMFFAFGQTLFASTMAANVMVVGGAFVSAYATVWMFRSVPPHARWQATILMVFVFYYAARTVADAIGLPYPATFDPGVSLRPLRGFLPFFVLPCFVIALRKVRRDGRALAGGLLGMVAGAGLLWSNDAGIPLMIAMVLGLVMALHQQATLLLKTLAAFGLGVAAGAGATLMLVTHGQPGPWLQYNFQDVAGDQFWFFAPWDRTTRFLELADLPNILRHGEVLSTASVIVLTASVMLAMVQRLRGRGSPVRGAAFVFVGASVIGTALIPQIGGHIGAEYNAITFVLGASAPLILAERVLLRPARSLLRKAATLKAGLLVGIAAVVMVGVEAERFAAIWANTDRVLYDDALGFHVTPQYAADLHAMRRLSADWRIRGIPEDRQLLSVYTSPLDIVAGVDSPTPVGSLIHALGARNRNNFTAKVANRSVASVTTIAPDYSGWEGWIVRANWPFFESLWAYYRPIARTDQNVLWAASHGSGPIGEANCSVLPVSSNKLRVIVMAQKQGVASVRIRRSGDYATARSAVLTVTENSPYTRGESVPAWSDFPRYGVANTRTVSVPAPVEAGNVTELTLEVLDGSDIGSATCSAQLMAVHPTAALPGLPDGISRYLTEARP